MYFESNKNNFSEFHGYAYDGIWAIARAVDHVIRMRDGAFQMKDFRSEIFQNSLNQTDFLGVTVNRIYDHLL